MQGNSPFVMRPTREDEELFQFLHDSNMGKPFARFLERLGDALCDSRTLKSDISTPEGQVEFKGRRLAAEVIQENLYRPIVQRDSSEKRDRSKGKSFR